jgi:hypothetical protein
MNDDLEIAEVDALQRYDRRAARIQSRWADLGPRYSQ